MSIRSASIVSAVLAVIVTFGSVAAPAGAQTAAPPLVSEARLGPVPDHPACLRRSADGLHVAMVANRRNRFVVVHDGVEGPEFDEVMGPSHEGLDKDGPVFSADGRRMAYVGRRAGKWIAVVDGVEGPPYEMIFKGGPRFSPDGSRVAYGARSKAGVRLVVDGAERPVAWAVKEYSLVFGPDGKRLSYVICEGANETRCRMVVDSVAGPIHDWIGRARFSADGERYAYPAIDLVGLPEDVFSQKRTVQRTVVYVDGDTLTGYLTQGDLAALHRTLGDRGVVFSPDGRHLAFAGSLVRHGLEIGVESWQVAVDGLGGPVYTAIAEDSPEFSSDSRHVAYAARTSNTKFRWSDQTLVAVVDGVAGPEYELVTTPRFSPDGQHVAYLAKKPKKSGGKWSVVVDGVEGPEHDDLFIPVYSPDSKRIAFTAVVGQKKAAKQHQVVDGVVDAAHERVGAAVFSPDSRRVAYWAEDGKATVLVADGAPGPVCDEVGYIGFSPDSRHLSYWARQGAKQRRVLDGIPGPEYDEVIRGGPVFRDDGTLEFLAVRQGVLYRVSWAAPAKP